MLGLENSGRERSWVSKCFLGAFRSDAVFSEIGFVARTQGCKSTCLWGPKQTSLGHSPLTESEDRETGRSLFQGGQHPEDGGLASQGLSPNTENTPRFR